MSGPMRCNSVVCEMKMHACMYVSFATIKNIYMFYSIKIDTIQYIKLQ